MKKILFAIFLLASVVSFGQVNYTNPQPSLPGIKYQRVKSDSVQPIPRKFKTQTDKDTTPHVFFHYDTLYQRVGGVVQPVSNLGSGFIRNQAGSSLSAQTAKVYVTDTIKTDGKVIASGVSGLSASSSVGITGINSSTGRAMSATSLSGEAIRASNNSTTSPTISINQFGSSNIAELLNGYGFGVKIDTSGSIIMSNSKSSAYTGKISIPFLNANRTYTLPDASGTLALTSDIPVSGTFTNRRIPFANSSGQLKDTTGFEFDTFGSLNVPNDLASTNGSFIANASGKGFYGAVVDIFDNTAGIIGSFWNSNSNGIGVGIRGGNSIEKYTLKLVGYNADSIANFNPLGAYFYKPINADSANFTNALNVGLLSGTGSVIVRKTTGAQAAFYGSSDITNNRDGSGKIILGSNGSYQGVIQYYDGGSTTLYLDNSFDNASAQIKLRLRTNGTPVDALTLDGTGNATIAGVGTGTLYSNVGLITNTNPSDSALKDSIKTLTYGLNEILQLKPKTFYYKSDSTHSSLKYGFIAQDVQPIMPDMVRKLNPKDPNSKLGLETDGIYVTMVKAIQELSAENDTLKLELADIKAILQRNSIKYP